jgi:hypothetical protein
MPFSLATNTIIFYNGQPLRSAQWSGSGTTTLTAEFETKKYDYLVVSLIGYSVWVREMAADDENDWTVPVELTSTSIITYNGQPLRAAQWGGTGTTELEVNFTVYENDYLMVQY